MVTVYEGPRLVSATRRRPRTLRATPTVPVVDEREGLPAPATLPVSVVTLLRAPALEPPSEIELQPPFGADPLPTPAHEHTSLPFWEPEPPGGGQGSRPRRARSSPVTVGLVADGGRDRSGVDGNQESAVPDEGSLFVPTVDDRQARTTATGGLPLRLPDDRSSPARGADGRRDRTPARTEGQDVRPASGGKGPRANAAPGVDDRRDRPKIGEASRSDRPVADVNDQDDAPATDEAGWRGLAAGGAEGQRGRPASGVDGRRLRSTVGSARRRRKSSASGAAGGVSPDGDDAAGQAARAESSSPSPLPRDAKRAAADPERLRSAAVAYVAERELRVNGLSSTQLTRPRPERRLFVARPEAAEVDVESSIHQVTAWAALRLYVGMCVEVLNGYRPAGQLRPMSDPQRFTDITDQLVRRTVRVRMSPAQAARQGRLVRVRRMLVCEPLSGIAEAAVVLEQGDICWSMAVRMERTTRNADPATWRCVLVQVI